MTNQSTIPVIVNGAGGKMGREVIKAISQASDMTLMGAIDTSPEHQGKDAGELAGLNIALEVPITNQLEPILGYVAGERQLQPPVMVDFTHPDAVYDNVRSAIAYGIRPVVGTTGLSPQQLENLADFAEKASTGCLIIPNFSIGIVLLQQAAITASQYFDHVEIIELHHNQKADAPSGTAIQTAQLLADMGKTFNPPQVTETEKIAGARGCLADEGIRIHSVRLPGLIAHQEVIFGAAGQIYTLRHDTSDRSCYMPGVLLAIRKINQLKSLVYGLEKIL
ncbi:4-hydroxy-tetrahydrodipicolinate reductase [Cylindrospermopsis raciborskii CHAB3438]|jgi:4-hydroxy-tetrahydrodipicolinate reductase|uniref:4-hydroxy-tetrahydrodipicolinate reductase n=1 Tax=Cylindrospermopsis TaxID=77021 RepID=UPI00070DFF5E|nr:MULTISPECIES: 4-hydroxy-tetrahydrodipicolinate reductase [Cylindrospermopsis]BAZ90083.1 dihydrodipicolinate reductase [Raphidiopsis curvata NIES-932]KRH97290.1 4-hydroxy-tetrahydrodipicolinate reductase [Cylindrospermopsis sp. CR12]MCH4904643.1 4-hydroxy-tetrahydrodipicolinate reductase [Cylindrospermopsis raciborskii CHAB3438]MEB3145647.1 4-hydroxy-tetrahydrodipicolinate reductase [Cylindrospermopsis raciborskii]TPX28080.1 4-hydroxy-tetrahydrodipicolinate reductase [Cylindrospermopsis raci